MNIKDEAPGRKETSPFEIFGITECNVEGCHSASSTMVTLPDKVYGLCGRHFQEENAGNQLEDQLVEPEEENQNGLDVAT